VAVDWHISEEGMTNVVKRTKRESDPKYVRFVHTPETRAICEQVHSLLNKQGVAVEERVAVMAILLGEYISGIPCEYSRKVIVEKLVPRYVGWALHQGVAQRNPASADDE
jgi:hypothetical protein